MFIYDCLRLGSFLHFVTERTNHFEPSRQYVFYCKRPVRGPRRMVDKANHWYDRR